MDIQQQQALEKPNSYMVRANHANLNLCKKQGNPINQ